MWKIDKAPCKLPPLATSESCSVCKAVFGDQIFSNFKTPPIIEYMGFGEGAKGFVTTERLST